MMAIPVWLTLLASRSLFFDSATSSVFNEVNYCLERNEMEPCLVDHTIQVLLNVSDLAPNSSSIDGRSSRSIEDHLMMKLAENIGVSDQQTQQFLQRGRSDPVLRTFQRAWKYLIPFMIGILLKLATFVPMVLTVLTLIAKSAFLSGNFALLLTGLNIALKFWYPKWGGEHHSTEGHNSQHGGDFGLGEGYGQQQAYNFKNHNQFDPGYKTRRRISYIRTY